MTPSRDCTTTPISATAARSAHAPPQLEVALRHIDLGFQVFPLAGKVPVIRGGHTAATDDAEQVRSWWRFRPDANVGLRLAENIVVLDVDGPPGRTSLSGKVMPPTVTVSTPRDGGFHHYFRTTRRLRSRIGFLLGVDAKAGPDSYVVAAGSWSERYQRHWRGVPGLRWGEVDVADAPDWLVGALLPRQITTPVPTVPAVDATNYAAAALENEVAAVATAPEGQRNCTLNKSAFALGTLVGSGCLDGDAVRLALLSAARINGLLAEEPEKTKKTLESGLDAGKRNPRVTSRG